MYTALVVCSNRCGRGSAAKLYEWEAESESERFGIIGVRVGARTGYVIPGSDGNGGCRFEEIILPPSPPPPPSTPKSRVLGKIIFLRFLTHMRVTDAKLPGK